MDFAKITKKYGKDNLEKIKEIIGKDSNRLEHLLFRIECMNLLFKDALAFINMYKIEYQLLLEKYL